MTIRFTQATGYLRVHSGLNRNYLALIRAQEQVATGKRILRPSDDPIGTTRSLSLTRQLAEVDRYRAAIGSLSPHVSAAASAVDDALGLFAEARELVVQGLNGALNDGDRARLGEAVAAIAEQLLDLANGEFDDQRLFGGVRTDSPPFVATDAGGTRRVEYRGGGGAQSVQIGAGQNMQAHVDGSNVFASSDPAGTLYAGLTGARPGTTADQGHGYTTLTLRHDATAGALGAGIAFVAAGASDTFLGDRVLVVDPATNTARLGNGPAVGLPVPGSPEASDVRLTDEHGAEVHLDFGAWTGAALTTTLTGSGSISLDGATFTPIALTETDLELVDSATGTVLHVDTTGIVRAGPERVVFAGTVNAFDVLRSIADDLQGGEGLDFASVRQRLDLGLRELDRNFESMQAAVSALGTRSQRLTAAEDRLGELDVTLRGLRSRHEDADLAEVVLGMTQSEQTLQLAQATGARLLQNTLLNYLR